MTADYAQAFTEDEIAALWETHAMDNPSCDTCRWLATLTDLGAPGGALAAPPVPAGPDERKCGADLGPHWNPGACLLPAGHSGGHDDRALTTPPVPAGDERVEGEWTEPHRVRMLSANCKNGDHDDCAAMVEQDAPGLGITDCLCACHVPAGETCSTCHTLTRERAEHAALREKARAFMWDIEQLPNVPGDYTEVVGKSGRGPFVSLPSIRESAAALRAALDEVKG